jgi:nitric oxide reductase activation protein
MNLITECAGEYDVYFINFSDGEPGCSVHRRNTWNSYGGDTAAEHTKRQVQMMREVGVKILSYFISEYNTTDSISAKVFRKMYGENAAFVNVKNSTEVIRTLNNLLLKKGA